jgi:hypothetical protein
MSLRRDADFYNRRGPNVPICVCCTDKHCKGSDCQPSLATNHSEGNLSGLRLMTSFQRSYYGQCYYHLTRSYKVCITYDRQSLSDRSIASASSSDSDLLNLRGGVVSDLHRPSLSDRPWGPQRLMFAVLQHRPSGQRVSIWRQHYRLNNIWHTYWRTAGIDVQCPRSRTSWLLVRTVKITYELYLKKLNQPSLTEY